MLLLSRFALALAMGTPAEVPVDSITELCARFEAYDQNADGQVELARVEALHSAGEHGPRVLVLVEARLTQVRAGERDLLPGIERLVNDLGKEGYRAHSLSVELAKSELHQDGRYVLAIRELLRAFAAEDELAGAILLGHFPDAFLVRTVNWRRKGDVTFRKGKPDQATYKGGRYLRRHPEDIAHRADIVLADLDGAWEDIYIQPRTKLAKVTAAYPERIPKSGGPCLELSRGTTSHEDFFHLSDGKLEVNELAGEAGGYSLFLDDHSAGHECAPEDRARPNVIARPDILISRIDAMGTALRPRTDVVGVSGEGLLDEQGEPQVVEFTSEHDVPDWRKLWEPDPALERQLLDEYLERNHAYRTGVANTAWRPSSIACDLGSGFREMSKAAGDWAEADAQLADLRGKPTLERFAAWMTYPAVLRTVRAHSDAWGSVFKRAKVDTLEQRIAGASWSWTRRGNKLEPSLHSACAGGKLDWYLLRTLWENGAQASEPSFYHHTGCHGISPPNAKSKPYDHPSYGRRQGAEALLLHGNGLALIGRSKVFYDEPRGFAETLAGGGTFGAAWARYYELESNATSWSHAGGDIGRKRSYFWSVLGDWTLRLSTAAPE